MADQPKTPKGWVDSAWDGSESQYKDANEYCGACLIDLNASGDQKVKNLCMLPYKESSGAINVRGVMAAAGGHGLTQVTKPNGVDAGAFAKAKRAAAKKLASLYDQMGRTCPDMIKRMGG